MRNCNVIGNTNQMKELYRIGKVWKNSAQYEAQFGQDVPHVVLLVGPDDTKEPSIVEAFLLDNELSAVFADEDEFPRDFQGWIKHAVARAMSSVDGTPLGSVAVLKDLDVKLESADPQPAGTPQEIFEFEMGVPKEHGLVLVTARSERPLGVLKEEGVFDRIIRLGVPTVRENARIFKKRFGLAHSGIDWGVIASLLCGKTVRDLEKAVQIASEIAFDKDAPTVEMKDLVEACLILAHDAREITEKDKCRLTASAYHEAGHALVLEVLRPRSVAVASIKTYHSRIAGVTCEMYPDERWDTDRDQHVNILAMLAGKAAVQAKLNQTDVGAIFDIKMAKLMERRRVEKHEANGFRDLFGHDKDVGGTSSLSDDYDRKVRANLADEYDKLLEFFSQYNVKDCLDALAQALLRKDTLLGDEVRAIMEKHRISENCAETLQLND